MNELMLKTACLRVFTSRLLYLHACARALLQRHSIALVLATTKVWSSRGRAFVLEML
jgi:hypothetical protein